MELTEAQKEVVKAPKTNLLISAAAGSGKTSVMVERIASRIASGETDLRQLLVMTFTKMAAVHMQDKIEKRLLAILSESGDEETRQRIVEQLSYLPRAQISTVHSFCLEVIQNFGYHAKTSAGKPLLQGQVETLDETRRSILFQSAVEEVLNSLYEKLYQGLPAQEILQAEEPKESQAPKSESDAQLSFFTFDKDITFQSWFSDFERMLLSLGDAKSDGRIRDYISKFHSFLRSMPDYRKWLEGQLHNLRADSLHFSASQTAKILLEQFEIAFSHAASALEPLKRLAAEVDFVKDKKKNLLYREFYQEQLQKLQELGRALASAAVEDRWDICAACAASLPEGKGASLRASDPEGSKRDFFALYEPVYEVIFYLTGQGSKRIQENFYTNAQYIFSRSSVAIGEDLAYMLPVAECFFTLLLQVDQRYQDKKQQESYIDFADYEHLALRLLQNSEAGAYYQGKFKEIYIDEYQDNSRIQEALVSAIASDNCFMVGDIKQSIYRFRHARPEIFLQRSQQYQQGNAGRLLHLNSNFRSRPGVLNFVNDIFTRILSADSGEIDYDDTQRLFPELPALSQDPSVTLYLVNPLINTELSQSENWEVEETLPEDSREVEDSQMTLGDESEEKTETIEKRQKEALVVVREIRRLVAEGAEWRDIAILARQNKDAALYSDFLQRYNIPTVGEKEKEFFQDRELLLMENVMRLLDNFCQDIPLAAVMQSAFRQSQFRAEEMAEIVLFGRKLIGEDCHFYEAVLSYQAQGEEKRLKTKLASFCGWIQDLRSRSMYCSISELIEQIYIESGLEEIQDRTTQAFESSNSLELFKFWANSFEKGRRRGLYHFVSYLQDIRNRKEKLDVSGGLKPGQNAVQCMSIHKSKGLEFKYVFLVAIDKSITAKDSTASFKLSENFGIAINYIRPDLGYSYPTHGMLALRELDKRAQLAEEMRLLYVALTRAEEKLYLVGSLAKNQGEQLVKPLRLAQKAAQYQEPILPAHLVAKATSYLELILMAIAEDSQAVSWLKQAQQVVACPAFPSAKQTFQMEWLNYDDLEGQLTEPEEPEAEEELPLLRLEKQQLTKDTIQKFSLQLQGQYSYEESTRIPAKVSVSELKRRLNDYQRPEEEEESGSEPLEKLLPMSFQVLGSADQSTTSVTGARKLTAPQRGTLLHSVFRYLDLAGLREELTRQNTKEDREDLIQKELEKMVELRMISPDMLPELKPFRKQILTFAESDLARRIVSAETDSSLGVFREIPFSLAKQRETGDNELIQGMIDCWFLEGNKAILVDYKSDFIKGDDKTIRATLKQRYEAQLNYYAQAITAATHLPVEERMIWLIPAGAAFRL